MPLAIDLFCGLGGWAEGFLAEGYDVIGVDIERHDYGTGGYPGQLVLQDVLMLHGSQFRDAAVIVASPTCQRYSYMAMPWKRAAKLREHYRSSVAALEELNALFNACFRIQREASEAAGRHIPMIVENVKGAQPWVGSARWHYGSYYLWGDVPALMPFSSGSRKGRARGEGGTWFHGNTNHNRNPREFMELLNDGRKVQHHLNGSVPAGVGKTSWSHGNTKHELRDGVKNIDTDGKTWFGVSHGRTFEGQPGNPVNGRKGDGGGWFGDYQAQKAAQDGIKQGGDWFHDPGSKTRRFSSRSLARKAASAQIAKIPLELARWIAQVYKP